MDTLPNGLINRIARNFLICLADFPENLKPEDLRAPPEEQQTLFAGLSALHSLIGDIYKQFINVMPAGERWSDREVCYQAIEAPVKLLWALGISGQIVRGHEGIHLAVNRPDLDRSLKQCGARDPVAAFAVLQGVGFQAAFLEADGTPCPRGFKKCARVVVRYPDNNDPLLLALVYYASRLPVNKKSKSGIVFTVFLRADFRPLLPDYPYRIPHLPAEEGEVTRTFDPDTLAIWREITAYMASHYPQCRLFFRVPRLRSRGWVADYSIKDNDYGLYSIFIDEGGLYVRIVLIDNTIQNMLAHVEELTPQFQEDYLNAVACKDCSHCGKHVFYTHGDHVHRLCKSPWFFSPYLKLEDLPDIERLIDFRLANVM